MKTQVKIITLLIALVFATSCASTHPGQMGRILSGEDLGLKVSAYTPDDTEDKKSLHQLIEVTFENLGHQWARIHEAEIVIAPSEQAKIGVVVGNDLVDWAKAAEAKAKLEAQNKGALLGAIAAVGAITAVVGGTSHSKAGKIVGAAGAVAAGGAVAVAASDAISASKRTGESADWVPADHLYQPFSVPADLFVRRWILLTKPRGVLVTPLVLKITTAEGREAHYELPMKFDGEK